MLRIFISLYFLTIVSVVNIIGQDEESYQDSVLGIQMIEKLQQQNKNVKYQDALNYFDENYSFIAEIFGEKSLQVALILDEKAISLRHTNKLSEALDIALSSLKIKSELSDISPLEIAGTKDIIGIVYMTLGKQDEALSYFEDGLKIKLNELPENDPKVAISYNHLGLVYFEGGKYDKASEYHNKALNIRNIHFGNNHEHVAQSLNNLGRVYFQLGNFDLAYKYYSEALVIEEQLFGNNHAGIARSYHNLALLLNNMGQYHQAINMYNKAIPISISFHGDESDIVAIHYNGLGASLSDIGNYEKSNFYYRKSLNIKLKIFGEDHYSVGSIYNNLGINYSLINEYKEAEECHRKAFEIRKKTLSENHRLIGDSYHKIGLINIHKGDLEEARKNLNAALNNTKISLGENHYFLGKLLISLSKTYLISGDMQKAYTYLIEADSIFSNNTQIDRIEMAYLYQYYGQFYEKTDSFVKAEAYYLKALDEFISQNLTYNANAIETEYLLSLMHEKNNNMAVAYEHFKSALKNLSYLTETNFYDNTKQHFLTNHNQVFELGIRIAINLFDSTSDIRFLGDVLDFMEKNKALLLHANLMHTDALSLASVPDFLKEKEYTLKAKIHSKEIERMHFHKDDDAFQQTKLDGINSDLINLATQYEEVIKEIETNYPDYYKLKYNKKPISLSDLQSNLEAANQSLLSYFFGERDVFALLINSDTVIHLKIPRIQIPDTIFENLHFGLYGYYTSEMEERTAELYRNSLNKYTSSAVQLYTVLIKPLEKWLKEDLLIISDGQLSFVPFEALMTDIQKNKNRFQHFPFLLNKHNISYDFSATIHFFLNTKSRDQPSLKTVLAMAPFYNGSYKDLGLDIESRSEHIVPEMNEMEISGEKRNGKRFSELPSSGKEVAVIAKFMDGDFFINNDATVDRFSEMAPSYSILHLSTHGVSDERLGDFSFIAFHPDNSSEDNSLFLVRNIYGLKLNADMVVLSACETAKGQLQKGEGVIGLSRAFIYAGAKSVLSSLWLIDDFSTKDIMEQFYFQLSRGASKKIAIKNAKKHFLKHVPNNNKHPFFWAGFILYGSDIPLNYIK
ncbi:MAG: CHAT domain-containing protein [Saprospiraceae bacterium]|nr:CHAT domain-containing protein [Saprospiraceae bacterium]